MDCHDLELESAQEKIVIISELELERSICEPGDVQVVEVGPKFERADPFRPGPRPALARPGEDAAIAASSAAMGSVSLTRRRRVIRPGIQRLKAPEAAVVVAAAAPSSASVAPRRPAAAARGPSERRRHLEP